MNDKVKIALNLLWLVTQWLQWATFILGSFLSIWTLFTILDWLPESVSMSNKNYDKINLFIVSAFGSNYFFLRFKKLLQKIVSDDADEGIEKFVINQGEPE